MMSVLKKTGGGEAGATTPAKPGQSVSDKNGAVGNGAPASGKGRKAKTSSSAGSAAGNKHLPGFMTNGPLYDFYIRHASQPADVSMRHAYFGLAATLLLTLAVFSFVYGSERADLLFSSREGRLSPLQYSSEPNTSSEAVVRWTAYAVSEIFTYNFNNVEERLSRGQRYFTSKGWSSFRDAISQEETLVNVRSSRSFVTVVPSGTPVVSSEGEVDGVYSWVVEVPLLTNVYTASSDRSSNGVARVTIESTPTRDSPSGYAFGIARITR